MSQCSTLTLRELFETRYLTERLNTASESTVKPYRNSLRQLEACLGRPAEFSDLNDETLRRLQRWYIDRQRRASTSHQACINIEAVWRHAKRLGLVDTLPTGDRLAENKPAETAWSEGDLQRILQVVRSDRVRRWPRIGGTHASLWWETLIRLAYEAKLPPSFALKLRQSDYLPELRRLTVPAIRSPRRSARVQILSEATAGLVERLLFEHEEEVIFPWHRDRRRFAEIFNDIARAAGIPTGLSSKFHRVCTSFGELPRLSLSMAFDRTLHKASGLIGAERAIAKPRERGAPRPSTRPTPDPSLQIQPTDATALSIRRFYLETYKPQRGLLNSPQTDEAYLDMLSLVAQCFGADLPVALLSDERVSQFLGWLLNNGRSPATANKHLRGLRAIARFAHKKHLLPAPLDVRSLPQPRRGRPAWSIDEVSRMLAVAAAQPGDVGDVPAGLFWESLILFILDTGTRIGATMAVRSADVDLARRSALLRAETQKQNSDQVARFSPQTGERLAALLAAGRGDPRLFPWPYDHNVRQFTQLRKRYANILRIAGLTVDRKSMFHRLRRTTATLLFRSAGIDAASLVLGHSTSKMTRDHYVDFEQLFAANPLCDSMPRPQY